MMDNAERIRQQSKPQELDGVVTDPLFRGPSGSVKNASNRIMSLLQEGKPPAKPEIPQAEATDPDEQVVQDEEPEEVAVKTEEAEPDEPETDEAPIEDEAQVTRFGELSDHLGVDEDYLLSLSIDAKVNGQSRSPTIRDLLANYQKGESAEMRLMEAADNRKKFESEMAAEKEKLQQEWGRFQAMQSQLDAIFNEDDPQLEELRHSDPSEYAARMQERQHRQQRAEQLRQQLYLESAQKRNQEYERIVASERPKLLSAIPEWQDERTQQAEAVKLRQYLIDNGFRDYEVDGKFNNGVLEHPGIVDHRAFVVARKAMLYDEAQKNSAPKKEKLKSLPKVGTGKKVTKSDVEQQRKQETRAKLKQSGQLKDAAAVIFEQINRGASK